jgi:hypothetical protein
VGSSSPWGASTEPCITVRHVEVQGLLGHASLNTTGRYLDAAAGQLRDVTHAHPARIALRAFTTDTTRR